MALQKFAQSAINCLIWSHCHQDNYSDRCYQMLVDTKTKAKLDAS